MELTGETLIAAPRAIVWQALTDPAILARCIDVETLTATTDAAGATRFDGTMNARVGPVRATFAGGVTLTEVDVLNRYVLVGEGKGGVAGFAGFAKGTAEVKLSDSAAGTLLAYAVSSSVGGKLAQLEARLIEGTVRGYAETFLTRLKAEVETPAGAEPPAVAPDLAAAGPPVIADRRAAIADDAQALHGSRPRTGLTPLVWCVTIILVVLVVLAWELR